MIVISCEKDFTDIGTSIISNTKFNTKDTILEVLVSNVPVESVRADALELGFQPFSGFQGQYLLGVHINDDYEDVEASIISQVIINTQAVLNTYENPDKLLFATQIDTAFLRIPYQATLLSNTDKPLYSLDSVVGDLPFTLNVYQINTFLSRLNPDDPSKINSYTSDQPYEKIGSELNEIVDMDFLPSTKDTLIIVKRKASDGSLFDTDTIRYSTSPTSEIAYPMAIIPLKKSFAKDVFIDNFNNANFDSQATFNDYFRGILIEAKEKTNNPTREGSLISFDMSSPTQNLNPFIDVFYTNTYFKENSSEIDTVIKQNYSFQLGGIVNNKFKMSDRTYPSNNEVKIQGLAGSEAKVEILKGTQLDDLRAKNWLINDASLTFYINQSADTTLAPNRLHLYKRGLNASSNVVISQIKDKNTEPSFFGGFLQNENNKKDSYTFRITDHISDLLNGNTTYNPDLRLKVYNPTDQAVTVSDTVLRPYNWSSKAITILNHDKNANGVRRARLKISYTEKN